MPRSRHMGYTSVCTVDFGHVAVCGSLDRSLLVLPVRTWKVMTVLSVANREGVEELVAACIHK